MIFVILFWLSWGIKYEIMKIRKVRSWSENLDLKKPYTIAYRRIEHVENLFVAIELENGITGVGAGSPAQYVTGEDFEGSVAALSAHAEEVLSGRDIRQFKTLVRNASLKLTNRPAALAAVDIALYDAFSQYLDVPLCDFLGKVHDSFPTSVTIGIQSLEETLEDAKAFLAEGFKVIKLKIGLDVEQDTETFTKLRAFVGPNITLRVDINQGYSPESLIRFWKSTEHLQPEFFEQPLIPGRLQDMRQFPEALRLACAADEDLHSMDDAVQMGHRPMPYGIYNIKLMKSGGVDHALKIAEVAEMAGIQLMWGCNDESRISISAALHAALASTQTKYLDLDGSFDLARDIVQGGFLVKDGKLLPNGKPGLGLTLL
jgi:L-alanine-DL-glutamate epimerase-like enolase superfamily enzyme